MRTHQPKLVGGWGASRYLGVVRTPSKIGRPWTSSVSYTSSRGKIRVTLGAWKTQRQAAIAHDCAALYYGGPRIRLNFPADGLKPVDGATLRAKAGAAFKRLTASRYLGVGRARGGWHAVTSRKDGRHAENLGIYKTEIQAAEAVDRAARFTGDPGRNFPRRRLQAVSPAELRRQSFRANKIARNSSSSYRGVYFLRNAVNDRVWMAQLCIPGQGDTFLGKWASEQIAARMYDRGARFYLGADASLNFPDDRIRPASAPALIAIARKQRQRSGAHSEYTK